MEQKTWILKPNVNKALIYFALKIIFATAIIIGGVYFFSAMGVFESFKMTAETLVGEMPSPERDVKTVFSVAVGIIAIILIALNYLILGKLQYIFYENELFMSRNLGFIKINEKRIPFDNIMRVTLDNNKAGDKLFGTYTINLELSGMKEKNVQLEFMDDGEKVAGYIQWLLNNHKQKKLQEQIQTQRVTNIVDIY